MTPRERVEAALRRQPVDKVPFTAYENKLIQCEAERRLRNEGLCVVERRYPVYRSATPDVRRHAIHFEGDDGVARVRTVYETPVGTVSTVDRPVEGTTWHEERLFKTPEDYAPIEFMIRNRRYQADYAPFLEAQRLVGEDVLLRPGIGYSPLQEIVHTLMGVETFAVEWAENREEVLRLYRALTEDRRKLYPIVAESPALAATYCGNVSPEVMGPRRFEEYVLPHYDECAEVMHRHGKLVGPHLDANNVALAPGVARSKIDFVEAFTPPPTCDLSVAEARRLWPDKVLWINFPSTVHLFGPDVIEETMRQILAEAAPGDGFLVGITENVPPDRWQESFAVISRTIDACGRYPIRA